MKYTEQDIWAYIDRQLSTEDQNAFEQALNSDNDLANSYQDILHMHQSLQLLNLNKAPTDMHSLIMDKVVKTKKITSHSFIGFKYFVWGFIVINVSLLLLALLSTASVNAPSKYNLANTFSEYYTSFINSLPTISLDYNKFYVLTLASLLFIFTINELSNKFKIIRSKS